MSDTGYPEKDYGCSLRGVCGGCFYWDIDYREELLLKEKKVLSLLRKACPYDFLWEGIERSPRKKHYRNKMEYSFGNSEKNGPLTLGLHKRKSFFDVLCASSCELVHEDFGRIVSETAEYMRERGISFFHRKTHKGYLRHLLVRRAFHTEEILVDLVTAGTTEQDAEEELLRGFSDMITDLERRGALSGSVKGVLHTRCESVSDAIRDDGTEVLYGSACIEEELMGLSFRITPFSFFQPNTLSAELLYRKVMEYVLSSGEKCGLLYDLYSGTGTISQILSPIAEYVVGIEISGEAVESARKSAMRNHLTNVRFEEGDVLHVLDRLEAPDMIVLDPPRSGLHPKALRKILSYDPKQIVYVSCNPESLANDLGLFHEGGMQVTKAWSIDQFPRTAHVEAVVLMSRVSIEPRKTGV